MKTFFFFCEKKILRFTGTIFTGVGGDNLVVIPQMGNGHAILGQSAGFVRANSGGWSQCLHGFQIFYKAVFLGHSFCRQSQAHLTENLTLSLIKQSN